MHLDDMEHDKKTRRWGVSEPGRQFERGNADILNACDNMPSCLRDFRLGKRSLVRSPSKAIEGGIVGSSKKRTRG
jgi:hypothetical protein